MLEFVHSTGSKSADDSANRRKVRSQAMRDFRRRQRAEREAASKPSRPPHDRHLSVPNTGSEGTSWQGRDRAASTGSESASNTTRRLQGRSTRSKSATTLAPTTSQSVFQIAPEMGSASEHAADDTMATHTAAPWDHLTGPPPDLSPRPHFAFWPQEASSRASTPAKSQERGVWATEAEDPFDSAAQINQMFVFCKSYINWLHPGTDAETAGKILWQAWTNSKKPMLLAACCLASVGHLDAVQPNRPGGNYAWYKARVLRDVSERMRSPDTATSDETIGALGCLLSYEMSRGSEESLTHLRGLRSIVDLNGVLPKPDSSGLLIMLESLDLIHAVVFDSQPVLTRKVTAPYAENDQSDADVFARLIPILGQEQKAFHKTQTPYSVNIFGFHELLQSAATCLRNPAGNEATTTSTFNLEATEQFRSNLETFGQRSCRDQPLARDAFHLGRACYLVLSVFFNLVVSRVPHRHSSNQLWATELSSAVRNVQDRTWEQIPYLRLYILLSGAVSTTNQGCKSYFKAQLVRCIYQMGILEWKRVKTFVLRFIEMKQVLERPERRSTPPIELPAVTRSRHQSSNALTSRASSTSTSPNLAAFGRYLSKRTVHEPPPLLDDLTGISRNSGGFMHLSVAPSRLSWAVTPPRAAAPPPPTTPFNDSDIDPLPRPPARIVGSDEEVESNVAPDDLLFRPGDWIAEQEE